MNALLTWIEDRTAARETARATLDRTLPGGAAWRKVWPSAIVFVFCVQAITGWFLWMYYSPSAQTAWESVHYIQHEVMGGWLVRGIHHYAAQVLVGLCALYVIQTIVLGAYRAPREVVFWLALALAGASLASVLTGDLLSWDQNGFWATQVRVKFLTLLPGVGGALFKLAAGGPAFGHLTLTRFFALHAGLFAAVFAGLLALHLWVARRAAVLEGKRAMRASWYWPDQVFRNALACVVVMLLILALTGQHALTGGHAGLLRTEYLGAPHLGPADPIDAYAAARPEWSLLGVYELSNMFPGELKLVPIFIIPSIGVLILLVMPFTGRWPVGHFFNVGLVCVALAVTVVLSLRVVIRDAHNAHHQEALAEGREVAHRAVELARSPQGIPVTGALSMLHADARLQGPKLFKQLCASCHDQTGADGRGVACEKPSAPSLAGFATRPWVAGLLDPKQAAGPKYFGNTRFAAGAMVRYVEGRCAKLTAADRGAIAAALSAEARLPGGHAAEAKNLALAAKGRTLLAGNDCTRCHHYGTQGPRGAAPELTGYGSREWIMGMILDPGNPCFYGGRNDRMPAYHPAPAQAERNRLTAADAGVLADYLRGDWYEPGRPADARQAPAMPAMVVAGLWEARRETVPAVVESGPHAEARKLFRQECALCHSYTGGAGPDIVSASPSAPDLGRFAGREWLSGLLDRKQFGTPKYFGNTAFKEGDMADFVKGNLKDLLEDPGKEEFAKLLGVLAAESPRGRGDKNAPKLDADAKVLFEDFTCTDCHKFHEKGKLGQAPDLTGYGSTEWLVALLGNPAHARFYRSDNDGMPSYAASPPGEKGKINLLTPAQLKALAELLQSR